MLASQELRGAENFDAAFNLAQGPRAQVFPTVPASGQFPLPNGVFSRALPRKQRPPTVDAFNVTLQRQLNDSMSVEVGYVGNRGRDVFAGDGPAVNVNDPTLEGFPNVSRNQRQPFFANRPTAYLDLGGGYGWTQGIDYFCNCANNWYDSVQAKFNKRFSDGYAVTVNYTWQKARGRRRRVFLLGSRGRARHPGLGPHAHRQHHADLRAAVRQRTQYGADWSTPMETVFGGWQFNATHTMQSGLPFNVGYANSRRRPRHRTEPARISSAIRKGTRRARSGSTPRPSGSQGARLVTPRSGPLVTWSATR